MYFCSRWKTMQKLFFGKKPFGQDRQNIVETIFAIIPFLFSCPYFYISSIIILFNVPFTTIILYHIFFIIYSHYPIDGDQFSSSVK